MNLKKLLKDRPYLILFTGRDSGKTTIQRKRLENLIDTKLFHNGTIKKIEIDEFIIKSKFYTKCSRRRIKKI